METKNAKIESAVISISDGYLDVWLNLSYQNAGQGFGGYVLYLPADCHNHKKNTPAGHFIYRILEIAGVKRWKDLPGKNIRVKSDMTKIYSIGHIINDDWFDPDIEFRD